MSEISTKRAEIAFYAVRFNCYAAKSKNYEV
jgi:hypothetical protein